MKPNKTINKFFGESTFNFFQDLAMEYVEGHLSQTVRLYQLDPEKSEIHEIYGTRSSRGKVFKPPVELYARVLLEEQSNESYTDGNKVRYNEIGNLKVHIMLKHLQEQNVEVNYGDYIGYTLDGKEVIFEVSDNQSKDLANKFTMGGYAAVWKTLHCVPTDKSTVIFEE